jgi:hypothetical protein
MRALAPCGGAAGRSDLPVPGGVAGMRAAPGWLLGSLTGHKDGGLHLSAATEGACHGALRGQSSSRRDVTRAEVGSL